MSHNLPAQKIYCATLYYVLDQALNMPKVPPS